MKRLTTGILLAFAAAFIFGCGGSSAPTPGGGDNNGGNNDSNGLSVAAPDSISGSHNVTTVPGQLNVATGATQAQFKALAGKFGYSVLSFKSGHATVQVPVGKEDEAAANLVKQYSVISAERVNVINTPAVRYNQAVGTKNASFYPLNPWYSDGGVGLSDDGGSPAKLILANIIGQGQPMNFQGFPTAWDVSLSPAVAAEPVSIALIDAGWFDYSTVDRPMLDETILDPVNSGSVDGAGNFTPGLAAATWDINDDGDPNTVDPPYRDAGEKMLGVLAADINAYLPWDLVDFDGDSIPDVWNEGLAGINPNANYILIKTGTLNVDQWSFSDNELAASIDHAVAAGANIILLGMFGNAAPSATLTTAVDNARAAGVLVIAPAGDVVDSFNGSGFDDTPVDVSGVSPAGAAGVLSVAGTGLNRIQPPLPDVNGNPNNGIGWDPLINAPFDSDINTVASWSNTGADMAGVGFGMGFTIHPYIYDQPAADRIAFPGYNYLLTIDRFGSLWAAAYTAGAASQVYQTLTNVNGSTDDDAVEAELLAAAGGPIPGTTQAGILNAGFAEASAINGGNIISVLPPLSFTAPGGDTAAWLSQAADGVDRGTDLSIQPTVVNATDPITLTVNWGDGSAPTVVNGWTSGSIVTKTGGYADLGAYAITVTAEDANSLTASAIVIIHVINPLSANITIESATGSAVGAAALKKATTYRFNANPANVFTGAGNTTTFSWDFNGDAVEDATGPTPTFSFPSAGAFTVTLTVVESLRPDTTRTLDVTVSN